MFYSPQAKCMLMENSPHADFEMVFYNGTKVHISSAKHEITIRQPNTASESGTEVIKRSLLNSDSLDIPQNETLILKHAQECLKQCLNVENSIALDQPKYPVIIKSSHCPSSSSEGRATSPSPSIHPSAISSYSVSGQSVSKDKRSNANSLKDRRTIGEHTFKVIAGLKLIVRSERRQWHVWIQTFNQKWKSSERSISCITDRERFDYALLGQDRMDDQAQRKEILNAFQRWYSCLY